MPGLIHFYSCGCNTAGHLFIADTHNHRARGLPVNDGGPDPT